MKRLTFILSLLLCSIAHALIAPTTLRATGTGAHSASLVWLDNSSVERGYKVYRKTGDTGTYNQIVTLTANSTGWIDTGLSASTRYVYRVSAYADSGEAFSNEDSATTSAEVLPTTLPTDPGTTPPTTQPTTSPTTLPIPPPVPPGFPAGAIHVGPGNALKTLADLNNAMRPGKTYVIEGYHKFTASRGIIARQAGCTFLSDGASLEYAGTGNEFPMCIDVGADGVTIDGFEFRGSGKCIGVQWDAGVKNQIIANCRAPKGGLGTGIEAKDAYTVAVIDCDFPGLRRYGLYGKVSGATFTRVKVGPSLGGSYNGKTFNSEHGVRFEKFAGVTLTDCELTEPKKSGLNAKRGNGLVVINCLIPIVGLGPLGDSDGLVNKSDPAFIATGIKLFSSRISNHVTLEMNAEGVQFERCAIGKVEIVDDDRYKPWRKIASATFTDCTIGSWLGPRTRMVVR